MRANAIGFDMDELFGTKAPPPYSIPTLEEIRAKDNGLVAVSTFSGSGGSSTGLHWAGFAIPYASEFIPAARETYLENWPETFVDGRDIRAITGGEILEKIGLRPGELDLFEGSPPCSSFSSANNHESSKYGAAKVKNYSEGVKQVTDDLFDEWLRVLAEIQPRAILAENVPGLLGANSLDFYASIHSRLSDLGYNTIGGIYNAANYGAATSRRRLIISGLRKDIGAHPPKPRKLEHGYSIRDALATFPGQQDEGDLGRASMEGYAIGPEWDKLLPGESSEKYFQLTRCHWDRPLPSPTTATWGANPTHPDVRRRFTPGEFAWMFGYPPDYKFTGTFTQRHERVVRSVAPPLYRAHGEALARALKGLPR